jgi:hypothetical protein
MGILLSGSALFFLIQGACFPCNPVLCGSPSCNSSSGSCNDRYWAVDAWDAVREPRHLQELGCAPQRLMLATTAQHIHDGIT